MKERFAEDRKRVDSNPSIYFYFAAQSAATQIVLCRQPETLLRKPCCLLGHAKRPAEFSRANPILAARNHPHDQGRLGILKDRSNHDRDLSLWMPSLALPEPSRLQEGNVLGAQVG